MGTRSLHACAKFSWITLAELLLKKGATIDPLDKLGRTPLMIACTNTSVDVAHLLLEHQADVNARDISRFGMLHYACKGESVELLEELIEKGCDVNEPANPRK